MSGFSPQMDGSLIIISGVIQGLGLGLVFVPLSTVAFATLDARFRTDATSLFSLVRNIGSSIGISVVTVLLTQQHAGQPCRTVGRHHALQPEPDRPSRRPRRPATRRRWRRSTGMVNIQSLMISYVDDFKLMMIVTLLRHPADLPVEEAA